MLLTASDCGYQPLSTGIMRLVFAAAAVTRLAAVSTPGVQGPLTSNGNLAELLYSEYLGPVGPWRHRVTAIIAAAG
jgi:hypothetical protein